ELLLKVSQQCIFTMARSAIAWNGTIFVSSSLATRLLANFSLTTHKVIFWFYFLVPYIGQWITRSTQPLQVGAFASCLVTFTLFEAAFFCEIMRAGIQSIPRGQMAAAQALGMTYPTTMGYIVLPQAFRNMVPVLLTQTIILFQ